MTKLSSDISSPKRSLIGALHNTQYSLTLFAQFGSYCTYSPRYIVYMLSLARDLSSSLPEGYGKGGTRTKSDFYHV
jgi:hypothetical protein